MRECGLPDAIVLLCLTTRSSASQPASQRARSLETSSQFYLVVDRRARDFDRAAVALEVNHYDTVRNLLDQAANCNN